MRHIIPDKILHGQDQARPGSKDILHGLNPDFAERLRPKEGIDVARGVEVHAPPWHPRRRQRLALPRPCFSSVTRASSTRPLQEPIFLALGSGGSAVCGPVDGRPFVYTMPLALAVVADEEVRIG